MPVVDVPALRVKPSVVVIATRSNGGPDLSADAKTLFETPLSAHVIIIPYDSYRAAAVASGFNAKNLADINAIRGAAAAAHITHAVVVEGQGAVEKESGKSVKVNTVEVSLIDADTGVVIYKTTRTLATPKLTRSVSTPIVAVIVEKISAPEEAPVAVVPVAPVQQTVAAVPVAEIIPPAAAATGEAPTESSPVVVTKVETGARGDSAEGSAQDSRPALPGDLTDVPIFPRFELRVGFLGLARDGRITGSQGGSVNYDGPMYAANLSARYFPFTDKALTSALHGVGIYGEGYAGGVSSDYDAANASNSSAIGSVELGAAYRFPLMPRERTPTLTFELGYAYATFPLSGVVFPGARYSSMELGFVVDVPIIPHVSVFAGGRLYPWMGVTGGLGNLGKADTNFAVRGEIGGRYVIAPFEVVVSGRYQQYNGSFKGITNLGLSSELDGIDYTDRYYGGTLSLGYLF
ncbi:MAG: hypothetical protein H7Z43_11280 [Clostridia bacterium]|nr:hypothetical protein [Deltaproteobacteria bacterium]